MGIKGLTKLIRDNSPGAIKETVLKGYTGMKICIDASNALYQFMVAIRSMGQGGSAAAQVGFISHVSTSSRVALFFLPNLPFFCFFLPSLLFSFSSLLFFFNSFFL